MQVYHAMILCWISTSQAGYQLYNINYTISTGNFARWKSHLRLNDHIYDASALEQH